MDDVRNPKKLLRPLSEYRTADFVAVAGLLGLVLFVGYLLLPPWSPETTGRPRSPCKNNLKQIGLALHNYHDEYKMFPPAFVNGPDGKPWHSWRVLILPMLGEEILYAEYRFDEPWDGPHNSSLIKRRPDVFCCPVAKKLIPPGHTTYSAVVGNEAAWPGPTGVSVLDIPDGTSNTIFVFEVRDAGIPWLAPEDLAFDEACVVPSEEPGRRPSNWHTGGIQMLMGDGAVRFVNLTIDRATWRALLTSDGGENTDEF